MKKVTMLVFVVGTVLMLLGNAYAAPDSITINSQHNSGDDYTFGFEVFFETGIYDFSVQSGAWNDSNFFYGSWLWSANIYQESTTTEFALGDSSLHYTSSDALSDHMGDGPVRITVSDPSGESLWFYINSDSEYNNRGSVTLDVAVVPEPVSTVLFVVGGLALAGRRYLRRNPG